ncbi:hypothetical protein STEG23_025652, partial [Scotinomys teguina]
MSASGSSEQKSSDQLDLPFKKMKNLATAISFFILVAVLGSQAGIIHETILGEERRETYHFKPPVVHQGVHDSPDCCFSYVSRIPCSKFVSYFLTSGGCINPGIIFVTKKWNQLCHQEEEPVSIDASSVWSIIPEKGYRLCDLERVADLLYLPELQNIPAEDPETTDASPAASTLGTMKISAAVLAVVILTAATLCAPASASPHGSDTTPCCFAYLSLALPRAHVKEYFYTSSKCSNFAVVSDQYAQVSPCNESDFQRLLLICSLLH